MYNGLLESMTSSGDMESPFVNTETWNEGVILASSTPWIRSRRTR